MPTDEEICLKIAEALEVKPEKCTPQSVLTDLVNDSFRLIEMAIDIQDSFDVIFSQDDLRRVITAHDLCELLRSRMDPQ